jgi:hypothetical protein
MTHAAPSIFGVHVAVPAPPVPPLPEVEEPAPPVPPPLVTLLPIPPPLLEDEDEVAPLWLSPPLPVVQLVAIRRVTRINPAIRLFTLILLVDAANVSAPSSVSASFSWQSSRPRPRVPDVLWPPERILGDLSSERDCPVRGESSKNSIDAQRDGNPDEKRQRG